MSAATNLRDLTVHLDVFKLVVDFGAEDAMFPGADLNHAPRGSTGAVAKLLRGGGKVKDVTWLERGLQHLLHNSPRKRLVHLNDNLLVMAIEFDQTSLEAQRVVLAAVAEREQAHARGRARSVAHDGHSRVKAQRAHGARSDVPGRLLAGHCLSVPHQIRRQD